MKEKNIILYKSFEFALLIVDLYKYLTEEKKEFIISKQLLRSGTSIGANIHEAQGAQSKADFISKLHIALKESYESEYWIKILEIKIVKEFQIEELKNLNIEIIKLLNKIIIKLKKSQ